MAEIPATDKRERRRLAAKVAYQRPGYRNFVLGMLTIVYVFNFIDRQIINILGQAIISDLGLTDGQSGAP